MDPSDPSVDLREGQASLVCIACAVCLKEVPISEAVVPEATDYLIYLCGLDCYQRWRAQRGQVVVVEP